MIEIVDYDARWPLVFEELKECVLRTVGPLALSVEHVGSTSVPGLAAKPVVDIDIIISPANCDAVIERLVGIGYVHLGDLGIAGREAFRAPVESLPHNLYACSVGSLALRNHLAVRDRLRSDPKAAASYGELKRRLAARYPHDIHAYIAGKTEVLSEILLAAGLSGADVAKISAVNRKP